MDNQIKIRVDEWATKIETTSEGTFIYMDESIKEEVLEEMERVLGGKGVERQGIPFVIIDGTITYADGTEESVNVTREGDEEVPYEVKEPITKYHELSGLRDYLKKELKEEE